MGFEPTSLLRDYLISSQGRYDHFDTCPTMNLCFVIIADMTGKSKELFDRADLYFLQIILYKPLDNFCSKDYTVLKIRKKEGQYEKDPVQPYAQ